MNWLQRTYTAAVTTFRLSASTPQPAQPSTVTTPAVIKQGNVLMHDLKAVFQTRQDIKMWTEAEQLYYSQQPIIYPLQLILNNICKDALLTSQMENRVQMLLGREIRLVKPDGTLDAEQTKLLAKMPFYRYATRKSLESDYFQYCVIQLSIAQTIDGKTFLVGEDVPRTNINPITGYFFPDYFDNSNGVAYRDLPEFGTWILEFYNKDQQMPLLNKAVPHVLFKRFAQSCHSELCEIYGIPPRVMKTNTRDAKMMARAQQMLKDMGAAAWFIIDEKEEFEFAAGATTNGDVYQNLITLCNNEMCLLILGAILGQDTRNGSRSKDQVALDILNLLVASDAANTEIRWNNIILPALRKHGFIKGDLTFEYVPYVDLNELFERVIQALNFYEIDVDWFSATFGIPITAVRPQPLKSGQGNNQQQQQASLKRAKSFFAKAATPVGRGNQAA